MSGELTAVLVIAMVIGIPVLLPAIIVGIVLKHKREMALHKMREESRQSDLTEYTDQYQEFVLGVDSRIRRLEDRIRSLESRLSNSSDTTDTQHLRRG